MFAECGWSVEPRLCRRLIRGTGLGTALEYFRGKWAGLRAALTIETRERRSSPRASRLPTAGTLPATHRSSSAFSVQTEMHLRCRYRAPTRPAPRLPGPEQVSPA